MERRPLPLHWLWLVSCVVFGIFSGCGSPPPPIAPTEQPRITPTEQPRVTPTEPPRVVGVDVIGSGTTTVVGGTVQFYAVVRYSDGAMVPKPKAAWRSSDETVATINPATGSAIGRRAGRADIQGTYEGQTGSTVLDVTAP